MQIDTGADINVMSLEQWKNLNISAKMRKSSAKIKAYGNKKIRLHGKVKIKIKKRNREVETYIYITEENSKLPLISYYTAVDLNIV